jgi:putative copper export protein/mono/diheme cytochrome c family protein
MDSASVAAVLPRGLHLAAVLFLFGALAFRHFVSLAAPAGPRFRAGLVGCALAFLSGAAWLATVAGTMAGAANMSVALAAVPLVATRTNFGHVVCARLVLLALTLIALLWNNRIARIAALLAAGAAVALQPLLGHAGALEGPSRFVLIPIEAAHLLAAGAWLGGLFLLLATVWRQPPDVAAITCERFTPVGLIAVGTLAITALPQAGELIGDLGGLFGTQYGHLALGKIGLFLAALGLAGLNRTVLTQAIRRTGARVWLIASIATELVLVLAIIDVAATLGSTAPALHTQPVWPFAWRPSTGAWLEPNSGRALTRLLVAGLGAVAIIGASLVARRFRILALVAGAILVGPFVSSLALLVVPAWPTSYARSPTDFAVDAIAAGQELFAARCAACHDPAVGSGGLADLTAQHVWGHRDGELFWWISDGVVDSHGDALMPGFGTVLSEPQRWALIDFIHARNTGRQDAASGHWSPPVPAPATPLRCDGLEAGEIANLRGRVLLVRAGDAAIADPPGDAVTVRLVHDLSAAPGSGACIAAAPSAWDAWSVLAGVPAEHLAGWTAVVDPAGWLRSWLPPGGDRPAREVAIRDARENPIIGAAPPMPHHH